MGSSDVERVLSAGLPSLPEVAHRILRLAQNPRTTVEELADAIRVDPVMSAKILKTANSAFFGRQYKVTSVRSAIPVLGFTLIRTLVLGFTLTAEKEWHDFKDAYRKVWRRALIQAAAAERLAQQPGSADPDEYFVCGLIQDVGVLALMRTKTEEYVRTILDKATPYTQCKLEKQLFGISHIDVGEQYCKNLQLAPSTIEAIRNHHEPPVTLRSTPIPMLEHALQLASMTTRHIESETSVVSPEFRAVMKGTFQIPADEIPDFFDEVRGRVDQAAGAFSVDIGELPPIEEILGTARGLVEDIAIRSQMEAAEAKRDVGEAIEQLERVRDRSLYFQKEMFRDALTGAFNRRLLETGLENEIETCLQFEMPLGLLFFDLDNFKEINDQLGHEEGDEVLRQVAAILIDTLRDEDLVIRYGGDEFLAVFMGLTLDALNAVAGRICQRLEKELNSVRRGQVSVSIGGIFCPIERLSDVDFSWLVRRVDQQMYTAKQRGGNQAIVVQIGPEDVPGKDTLPDQAALARIPPTEEALPESVVKIPLPIAPPGSIHEKD